MDSIGVIGAGQMGAGIAQVSAQAGYRVLLSDMNRERAEAGKAGIAKQLDRAVTKEKITADARDAALALIEPVDSVAAMAPAFLVIEAATEREEIKRAIFGEVGKVLSDSCDPRQQHLVDPDHAAGAGGPRCGPLRRRTFLQSGAGDGPDRADSRPRYVR